MRIVDVGAGHAPRSTMTVRDDMLNGHEICHGGFITTLADSAFAFACNSYNELTVASGLLRRLPRAGARWRRADRATRSRSSKAGRTGVYDIDVTNQRGERVALVPRPLDTIKGKPRRAAASAAPRRHAMTVAATRCPASSSRSRRASRDELRALQLERLRWSAAARLRQRAALPAARSTPRACIPDDLKQLADLAKFPFTVKKRPARQLSVRHVRGAARAGRRASTRRRARPASRPSSATRRTTSTPGPTWSRARSAPPAAGRATWSTSPTATACSPAAWARTTAPSALGCTVIPMSGGQTEKQVQLIRDFKPDIIMVTPSLHAGDRSRSSRARGIDPRDQSLKVGIFGAEPWTEAMRARDREPAPASTRSTSTASRK